ncbi:MAG: PAS domain-containing sensor histidine kinase [Gammaproteobacteria bacterium]|nr:MAG: PAS domain-containing sensor histidine kinase [Gammaproteobacteria bacterium]
MLQSVQDERAEQLKVAFNTFNQLSQNLTDSYQELEERVASLTQELAAARDERFKTLIEKELLASRLQQLLEALPGGVVVLDKNNQIVEHNSGAIELLNSPLSEQLWGDVVERSMQVATDNPHERTLKDGRVVSISSRWVESNNALEKIILLTDTSELNALQELVNHQKKLSAMGEMVASMAHQVRTPLSTAILYASQLGDARLNEAQKSRFSEKLLGRLRHMERQVNDMLVFARNGEYSMKAINLASFLEKIKESVGSEIQSSSITFEIINSSKNSHFKGNEDALLGVISNLISNARIAFDDVGVLKLTVTSTLPGKVRLSLLDDGPGIPEEQKKRIFEPFFTTRSQGTGLGLAVAESVVTAHCGRIWCESEVDHGTTFHVELPAEEVEVLLSGNELLAGSVKERIEEF